MSKSMKTMLVLGVLVLASIATAYRLGQRAGVAHALPVDAAAGGGAAAPAAPEKAAAAPRQVLYYRNPMGLPDTSPTPKKDSMGMDYIAVYADDADDPKRDGPGAIRISAEKIQKLGVVSEPVQRRALTTLVRASGRVEVDETRLYTIAPRFDGWIERLLVSQNGQKVSRGQLLFEVYSPELVSAQREYQIAAQGLARLKDAPPDAQAGMQQLLAASAARLANWQLSAAQIKALGDGAAAANHGAQQRVRFYSPASGVVLEKKAVQGMRFMAGDALYQIADIARVWVLADVFERDIAGVHAGQTASVRINAFPEREFVGRIDYVYPTLNAATRTVPVRVLLDNPEGLLRPAMYAGVAIKVSFGGTAPGAKNAAPPLTVPLSAVLDGGATQKVLVDLGEGRFAPRVVTLGRRDDDFVEVREGVREGERVVVAANFLIDSESQLKAAFTAFTDGGGTPAAAAPLTHSGRGVIVGLAPATGALTLKHGAIASLKWPAMEMEFQVADKALLTGLASGTTVDFAFHEGEPGQWLITRIGAANGASDGAPVGASAPTHEGAH